MLFGPRLSGRILLQWDLRRSVLLEQPVRGLRHMQ
jgi:hypothetical protein